MNNRRRKLLIITGVSVLVLFVAFGLFSALQHRGEIKVRLVVAPKDSSLTLNGQPTKSGTLYLKPGVYTVKASRQYFTDVTEKIDTRELGPEPSIYLLPGADTPEALKWLEDHPEDEELREAIGASRAIQESQDTLKKYPVVEKLPYKTLDYKIDYSLVNDELQLQISLYPIATTPGSALYDQQVEEFKQKALTYLKSQGVDLANTKIEYKVVPEE
jgi:hypothetical protein